MRSILLPSSFPTEGLRCGAGQALIKSRPFHGKRRTLMATAVKHPEVPPTYVCRRKRPCPVLSLARAASDAFWVLWFLSSVSNRVRRVFSRSLILGEGAQGTEPPICIFTNREDQGAGARAFILCLGKLSLGRQGHSSGWRHTQRHRTRLRLEAGLVTSPFWYHLPGSSCPVADQKSSSKILLPEVPSHGLHTRLGLIWPRAFFIR